MIILCNYVQQRKKQDLCFNINVPTIHTPTYEDKANIRIITTLR